MPRMAAVSALPLAMLLTACAGAGPGPPPPASRPASHTYRGALSFEARTPTPTGASSVTETRPARRVSLVVRDDGGTILARTATDDEGRFTFEAPLGATLRIVAEIASERLTVTSDALGRTPRTRELTLGSPDQPLEIAVHDGDEDGLSGALHILDVELEGALAVRRWLSEELPPLFTHWGRGETTVWSFYHGERPSGSGRFALELMGGDPGAQRTTDTDEHDEAIVLHEMGHFVMDRLTTDSSAGGDHPTGHLYDPGLAWEEARASFFAAAVLGAPLYWDTIGVEPSGSLRISHDLERGMPGPKGLGSEQGTAEILWDLADGAGGLPDDDRDPIALGPAGVLRAMMSLAEEPESFPCISSFLRHVVDAGLATEEEVRELLARGGHPTDLLPPAGNTPWPAPLSLPGTASGKIDGLSDPAPSGGAARPQNGFDAMHAYRVVVDAPGRLSVRLVIFGSGEGDQHEDLDVEVRDRNADLLVASRGQDPSESVTVAVEPGVYIVYVRDGGQGNRVGYEVRVELE